MQQFDADICGRSMRWYEWLLALLLLGAIGGVRAESVYKCTASGGDVAYQDRPCAQGLQEQTFALDAAPAAAPSPHYALPPAPVRSAHARESRPVGHVGREAVSYECRASDGEIFYRHSSCPHSMAAQSGGGKARGHASGSAGAKLTVSSREVSRSEACAQIHRAGAAGRSGRERDEDVSTYDRNLGRDPCK